MEESKLKEIHDYFIKLAEEAAKMIVSATPSTGAADTKKNSVDLVTETDQAVEKLISTSLKEKYPDILFMGEETYTPTQRLTNAPTFILDPIDGTTNFIHGHPYVAISLGLSIDRTAYVGVIYNPFTQDLYTAIRDHGAFLRRPSIITSNNNNNNSTNNGTTTTLRLPLRPPTALSLATAQVAVEWGSDRSGTDMRVKATTFAALASAEGAMVHSLRSFGSAALNMAGVAAGALDAYWEAGCWAWDVCAGMAILRETQGVVVDANPGAWRAEIDGRRYLAVRGDGDSVVDEDGFSAGQRKFIEEFWSHVQGRFEVGV